MASNIVARTGNEAMAEAMRQINPDVVAAYPITPATEIVQIFSGFVNDGKVITEFVPVESEHSALSACIGASAAGARVMTGTSSQGLALMHEMLYIAAGLRLPIVICEVNRALSAPINIHCDHSDTMGSRDAGWIQIFSEDSQEAYDQTVFAMKLAEDVMLPVMVTTDGFIISHAMSRVDMFDDKEVQEFIGKPRTPYNLLQTDKPITVGSLVLQDYYMEIRRAQAEGMIEAKKKMKGFLEDYNKRMNRNYDIIEKYNLDDAEHVIIAMGSTAGTAKFVSDKMRKEGKKVGVLKPRFMRPFFGEEIVKAVENMKTVAVLDRADTLSTMGGPLFMETSSAFYGNKKQPAMMNYIYGLGGRDINYEDLTNIFNEMIDIGSGAKKPERVKYITIRE